jgi:hypothetical protein
LISEVEVVPFVALSQTFPARPSIHEIRDFIRGCLAQSPLSEEDNREAGETVSQALLEAVGTAGAVNVSFRIFPDHVEVAVLRSGAQIGTLTHLDALASPLKSSEPDRIGQNGLSVGPDGPETGFAEWMAAALRREGMTMDVAARELGVSVKTVSRWVGGTTSPRLRDLRRIRELFGEFPLP